MLKKTALILSSYNETEKKNVHQFYIASAFINTETGYNYLIFFFKENRTGSAFPLGTDNMPHASTQKSFHMP